MKIHPHVGCHSHLTTVFFCSFHFIFHLGGNYSHRCHMNLIKITKVFISFRAAVVAQKLLHTKSEHVNNVPTQRGTESVCERERKLEDQN